MRFCFGKTHGAVKSRCEAAVMDWTGCDLVERVDGKLSGRPVVRGTRILVDSIVRDFDMGASLEEIQEDYPTLEADTIRQLVEFAHSRRRSAA
jgi:uncharacterized protein (DUF433 family)